MMSGAGAFSPEAMKANVAFPHVCTVTQSETDHSEPPDFLNLTF